MSKNKLKQLTFNDLAQYLLHTVNLYETHFRYLPEKAMKNIK